MEVVRALVVRVGEMVMDKSAGFMIANESLPGQLFNVYEGAMNAGRSPVRATWMRPAEGRKQLVVMEYSGW